MTDERFNISRRKALAALGTIGVASAGAGLGTSAYFSDQETFENNQLVAGELDLKVGYEEHYSDWSPDEEQAVNGTVNMTSPPGGPAPAGRIGLPASNASMINLANESDTNALLNATQISQYPSGFDSSTIGSSIPCDGSGNLADDDGASAPVINLADLKPGDFGEVSFSFALCDNPGYVWLQAFLESANENGTTEPEAEDDQEDGDADSTDPADVELLEEVQVAFWLDDGNNFQNGGEKPLFVGSLIDVISGNVPQIDGSGLRIDGRKLDISNSDPTDFTANGVTRFDVGGDGNYDADVELTSDPAGGSGKVAHATSNGMTTNDYVTTAISLDSEPTLGDLTDDPTNPTTTLTYQYYGGPENGKSAPDEVYLLIEESDGTRNVVYRASNDGAPADETWKTRNVHREVAGNPDNNAGFNWMNLSTGGTNIGGGGPTSDLSNEFGDDAVVLAMAAGRGTTGGGDVLDTYYKNPQVGGSSAGSFPAACFRGDGTVHNGVFAWWLPVDHANEIQTDTAEFTLSIYTEQCRHNPGDGNPPQTSATNNSTNTNISPDPTS